ncbi:MAG: hypothetical protein ABIK68_13250 [bacterium]
MKTKIISRPGQWDLVSEKVIQLCFDENSINNFSPGLKMVFALEDPPLFVTLEEIENEGSSNVLI